MFLAAKMDPYAILTYRTQEKKSSVASGEYKCYVFFARIFKKVKCLANICNLIIVRMIWTVSSLPKSFRF